MRDIASIVRRRHRQDRVFRVVGAVCTSIGVVVLAALLLRLFVDGAARIDWSFLTSTPSRKAERAGVLVPLVGSALVMLVTLAIVVPFGVAAGLWRGRGQGANSEGNRWIPFARPRLPVNCETTSIDRGPIRILGVT